MIWRKTAALHSYKNGAIKKAISFLAIMRSSQRVWSPAAHSVACSRSPVSPLRWSHHFNSSASATISALSFFQGTSSSNAGYFLRATSCATSSTHPCGRTWCATSRTSRCSRHAQLSANVRHGKARFDPFDRIHDRAVGEFWLAHLKPLPLEKILRLSPLVLGSDYPIEFTLIQAYERLSNRGPIARAATSLACLRPKIERW